MNEKFDLTGARFGRLTVIEYVDSDFRGRLWRCKCDCGNEKIVVAKELKRGIRSCGCSRSPHQKKTYQVLGISNFEDGGILALRSAILNQAAIDYREGNKKQKEVLEKWFLSEWGQFLSNDMGEIILERLQKGE